MASRHPLRRTQPRRESRVQNLWDPASVVSESAVDDGYDKLPFGMYGMELFFFVTIDKANSVVMLN